MKNIPKKLYIQDNNEVIYITSNKEKSTKNLCEYISKDALLKLKRYFIDTEELHGADLIEIKDKNGHYIKFEDLKKLIDEK